VTLQYVESKPLHYIFQYAGTNFKVSVKTALQDQYSQFMPKIERIDTSNTLVSPMPGYVLSVNVKPGDKVLQGQELCVVEAMKMQNVLRAERDCVIKDIMVPAGKDVAVDQVIIEFEPVQSKKILSKQ